jgi:hypothetical protein
MEKNMDDIKKIQIIHDVKETFRVDDKDLQNLVNQIEKNDLKENIDRFFRGYKIEDLYSCLFGALPWVKLIHGLEQTQVPPISKEIFQVPDYLCVYENNTGSIKPILIEVKSVNGDKKSLELMRRQLEASKNYSDCVDLPFLVGIYWDKYGIWTHVPIEAFEEKKNKYKITLEEAYKSDVSSIFGDLSFLIHTPIYRKTVYGNTEDVVPIHQSYGSVLNDYASSDGSTYFDITPIESAILDAIVDLTVISEKKDNDKIIVTEKSENNYIVKLSHWMLRHLGVFGVEPTFEYFDMSRRYIIATMKKLNVTMSYPIPATDNVASRKLYEHAFSGSFVWDNYKTQHNITTA